MIAKNTSNSPGNRDFTIALNIQDGSDVPNKLRKFLGPQTQSLQRGADIERHILHERLQGFLKVRQMLSVIHRAIARDDDGQHTIRVCRSDGFEDQGLVDCAAHGHDVGAGSEDEVVDVGDAERGGRVAGEEIVEGEVTHGDGHN